MSMEAQPALEPCMKVQRIPALTDMREQSLGHGAQPLDKYPIQCLLYLFHMQTPLSHCFVKCLVTR